MVLTDMDKIFHSNTLKLKQASKQTNNSFSVAAHVTFSQSTTSLSTKQVLANREKLKLHPASYLTSRN